VIRSVLTSISFLELVSYCENICCVLSFLHSCGVIHGSVSPKVFAVCFECLISAPVFESNSQIFGSTLKLVDVTTCSFDVNVSAVLAYCPTYYLAPERMDFITQCNFHVNY
jgi:serine/threonine protein kinase